MKRFAQLSYQTQKVQMSTTILESMINNMGEKIKNMSVKLQFINQQQKQAFLNSQHKIKQQSDAVSLNSEEWDEKQENQPLNQTNQNEIVRPKDKKSKASLTQMRFIEVPFEMSILLKEKYSSKFQKIGSRLSVEYIIVPKKVKIVGMKSELLDQAFEEFGRIQDSINLVPISEYGKQVFQSKYYKNLLKQNKLQILKILDKYYFWFEEGIANPNDLIRKILSHTKHKIYPLGKVVRSKNREKDVQAIKLAHGSFAWLELKTSVINELTIKIESAIFQKFVQNELNKSELRQDRKIELSEDREGLIIHLDADEQIAIQEENIKIAYEPFRYMYLVFSKDINLQYLAQFLKTYTSLAGGERFKKKKAEGSKLFFTEKAQNFIAVAYFQDKDKKSQFQNIQAYVQQHELMQFFNKLPDDLLNFKLILKHLMDSPDQQADYKKFSFQKDNLEKITFVSCKNQRRKNYQLMISLFIQGKFVPQIYKKLQTTIKTETQSSVIMDISRPVDESSLMLNNSNNISFTQQNGNSISQTTNKILPQDLSAVQQVTFRFEEYSLLLPQKPEERQKRYSNLVDVFKKTTSTLKNATLEKALNGATASKYKIWGLNVPLRYKDICLQEQVNALISAHPQLQKYNREVSVFYGGKQQKDFENLYVQDKKLKVYKIQEKSKGKQDIKIKEGYVLKTNIVFLYLQFMENGLTELPFGKYEALYYVKKLQ